MNETFEPPGRPEEDYRMQLFVAGGESNSRRARENLQRLCRQQLDDACEVQVIDVLDDYRAALDQGVLVVPTLVVHRAGNSPITIVGDLSDESQVLPVLRLALETAGE